MGCCLSNDPRTHREDGRLQALLELLVSLRGSACWPAPCVQGGSHVLSNGIPVAAWEYKRERMEGLKSCRRSLERLCFPFVKPSEQGSSVGITMVKEQGALREAIEQAFSYGPSIVIESGVSPLREIEISLLGNDTIKTSRPGEIVYEDDFYSYETKYPGRSSTVIPAEIPQEISTVRSSLSMPIACLAAPASHEPTSSTTDSGDLFFSEINTLPGFTPFSMFTKMWEAEGVSYLEVVERLAKLAIALHGPALR